MLRSPGTTGSPWQLTPNQNEVKNESSVNPSWAKHLLLVQGVIHDRTVPSRELVSLFFGLF